MKIFKDEPNFAFMKRRMIAFAVSGLIITIGIILFFIKDFNLGIDFTGGTMIEVSFRDNVSIAELRQSLKDVGLAQSTIVRVGTEDKFFIKTTRISEDEMQESDEDAKGRAGYTGKIKQALMTEEEKNLSANKLDLNDASENEMVREFTNWGLNEEDARETALKLIGITTGDTKGLISNFEQIEKTGIKSRIVSQLKEKTYLGRFTFLSTETVGPQVGHDMQGKATRAAIYAMIGMLIYIGFRFRFIYGFAAVITLLHDILFTLTVLLVFNVEISLQVVAAILTIVGYSLNDTIVIFDRVRDNVSLMKKEGAETLLDRSINQTLSRTIVTSGTTLCTVVALFFLGGEVIRAFSLTLIVGILIGTYSSIFQSCAWLKIFEKRFLGKKMANS